MTTLIGQPIIRQHLRLEPPREHAANCLQALRGLTGHESEAEREITLLMLEERLTVLLEQLDGPHAA